MNSALCENIPENIRLSVPDQKLKEPEDRCAGGRSKDHKEKSRSPGLVFGTAEPAPDLGLSETPRPDQKQGRVCLRKPTSVAGIKVILPSREAKFLETFGK